MDAPLLDWVMTVDPNTFNARWYAVALIRGHAMSYFIEQAVRGGEIVYAVERQFGWSHREPVEKHGFSKSLGDAKEAAAKHFRGWLKQATESRLTRTGTAGQS